MKKDEDDAKKELKSIRRMVFVIFLIVSVFGLLLVSIGAYKGVKYASKRYCTYNFQEEKDALAADFDKRRLANPDKYDNTSIPVAGQPQTAWDEKTKTSYYVSYGEPAVPILPERCF